MSNYSSNNSLSNVHWRYYLYDKEKFYNSLEHLNNIEIRKDNEAILSIIDSLTEDLEKDYKTISVNNEFLAFAESLNSNQEINKYLDLYYTLAKSKLTNMKNTIIELNGSSDVFIELREYYLRKKASIRFKNAWFYLNKYHASEDFFKLFIDDVVFEQIHYPNSATVYLKEEMYLNVILNKESAEIILKNFGSNKVSKSDLLLNDLIFFEGLQGVVNGKYIITYNVD